MHDGQLAFLNEQPPNENNKPTAYWLEDYHAKIWVLKGAHEKIELNWDFILPDGSNMVDDSNKVLLEACRRTLFYSKNPYFTPRELSCKRLKYYYHSMVFVAEWVILNKDMYNPKKHGFSRLDCDAIRELIRIFVNDGKDGLQGLIKRAQAKFEKLLVDKDEMEYVSKNMELIPKNLIRSDWLNTKLLTFSIDDSRKLRAWLFLNDFYIKVHTSTFTEIDDDNVAYILNDNLLNSLIGTRNTSIGNKTKLFLRQFEMASDFEKVDLVVRYETSEYLPSDYLSLEEKSLLPSTIGSSRYLTDLLDIFLAVSPINKLLPSPKVLEAINFTETAVYFGAGGDKHYRTTPPKIALQLIDSSIEYIVKYGDAIVDTYLDWQAKVHDVEAKNLSCSKRPNYDLRRKLFNEISLPEQLSNLNIVDKSSAWGSEKGIERNEFGGHPGAKNCRTQMSIIDAVRFLFASTYCLVASLSARRRMEIAELRCGCVIGCAGSYELEFYLRKSEFEGRRIKIKRPIPNIVARAIFILEKLHKGLNGIYCKENLAYIFSLPYSVRKYENSKPTNKSIDLFLYNFCDYINLEKTGENRRWYPKSHEFRRFFAIVFFWQFKFANLSAISWMMGHVSVEHTYAYIKEIIGGRELTRIEAEYSAEAILNPHLGDDKGDTLSMLRCLAKEHFQCNDIEVIEQADLEFYLEELLQAGFYSVRPHSFTTEQNVSYKMVFEICQGEVG